MNILGFDYPDNAHVCLRHDMWCEPVGEGVVRVGITSFGIHLSGDFYMCRPKKPGTLLKQGDTLGVAELSKSVVALKSPVSGEILEVNPLLEEQPEWVHREPYGRGWLVTVRADQWDQDVAALAHGAELMQAATVRMRLENMTFSQA